MRKHTALILSLSVIPLLFACSAPGEAFNSGDAHPAAQAPAMAKVSYLPKVGYQYSAEADGFTFDDFYSKAKPDLSHLPEDLAWIGELQGGTWIKDTDVMAKGTIESDVFTHWWFENDKYLIYLDEANKFAFIELHYPVREGVSRQTDTPTQATSEKVIGVGLHVSTPAGNFDNVIEVEHSPSDNTKMIEYLAPNVGYVKRVNMKGTQTLHTWILTSIKKTT